MTQFFRLSGEEAEASRQAVEVLRPLPWAGELVRRIDHGGGLTNDNRSFLFEARVGRAFHDCGVVPVYEHAAGVGGTSVDFHVAGWHVELLSLDETDAAKAATWEDGPYFGRVLASPRAPAPDEPELHAVERRRRSDLRKQSPEGETLKVIERIVGKAQADGAPTKFPLPDGANWSMLIVDVRAFGPIDRMDCRQIAYGAGAVPDWAKYRWIADDGREFPIVGAFDPANRMKGADHFRNRVHFIGIVAEESYEDDELQYFIRFYRNPALFSSREEALEILRTFPLFQPAKTRERRPDLFLHELFEQSEREIRFGIVADDRTVACHVHLDTLEDLERRSLKPDSEEMLQAFRRNEMALKRLASEMSQRGMVRNDGTIFISPDDLTLIEHLVGEAAGERENRGSRWI